jgi:prepilin peptidase CpaA
MDEMPSTSVIVLVISAVACVTDLRSRRIPNVLTFGAALAAFVYHGIDGGLEGFLAAAAGWLAGVAIFFLPFFLGGMGGGDVKLVAALGAWLGPWLTVWLALYTGVAGGVAAVVVSLMSGYLPTAWHNIKMLLTHWRVVGLQPLTEVTLAGSRGPRLAYAVPIFIGTVVTLWRH